MERALFPDYSPAHRRLVCIDSDGCAFDTMELKHKECFCPATVHAWGLQPISKYVREAWEYGNLYSKHRGRSRFHEILLTFDLLAERKEIRAYGFTLPDVAPLREWVENAPLLNNEELARHAENPVLRRTLSWSLEINERVAEMVHGVPPFPGVRESLAKLASQADIAIVSATPREALAREWREHDLMRFVRKLCAQEDGTKTQCIHALAQHYSPEDILMIGDAPGDMQAAQANGILFYPILPGRELDSWREFAEEGAGRFLSGRFAGSYADGQIEAFDKSLPDHPPWQET